MADQTRTKTRIYELTETTTLSSDMNLAVDTEEGGTKRVQLSTLIDGELNTEGKAADSKAVGDALAGKVDKEAGKGLSEANFTSTEKTKLAGIQEGAAAVDATLAVTGKAADAKKTGDEITHLKQDINELEDGKVNKPSTNPDGTNGQLLRTNGDGTTTWVDEGLPTDEQTAQAVSDWLDDHPEATTTVQDGSLTEAKFTNSLKNKTIKDYVTPQMFGGVGDGITNDTQAIMDAIDYVNDQGGGTVVFPVGVYLTDPIVLNSNYKDITLCGVGSAVPWKKVSTIKMRVSGSVAIQLSESTQQSPSWRATAIVIKNLFIECDNKTDIGINGNYDVRVENCVIRRAIQDGIVMEGTTYPFWVINTECSYNGRHGIYIKPANTTCYNIINCELSSNNGYGLYIEGGNTCHFDNVVIQFNKRGGMKIYRVDSSSLSYPVFLGSLLFTNLYFEKNGILASSDSEYDGNFAIKIDSYNPQGFSNAGVYGLTFINCQANASQQGGSWSIKGTAYLNAQNCNPMPNVDWTVNGFSIDPPGFSTLTNLPIADYVYSPTNKYQERIVRNSTNGILAKVGSGYIGRRGRMRELEFNLPDITAGQTLDMNPLSSASFMKGYGMIGGSSLQDFLIVLRKSVASGTLTFKLFYGFKSYGVKQGYIATDAIVMSAGQKHTVINFNFLQYILDVSYFVGVEITASSDFAFTNGVTGQNDILAELFIES